MDIEARLEYIIFENKANHYVVAGFSELKTYHNFTAAGRIEDPIEDQELLARYGMTPQEEYSRYFDDLNAYLLCLQKSQADIIEKGRFWHDRYIELFGSG